MGRTVAETIKEITRKHLTENNGLLLGQSITAVGWVNNTVPDCKGIIELPISDVAGAGIAVGTAIVGRRPILIIRFQDFMFLNSSTIVNYAAKTKDIFSVGTPIFVRMLAAESHGTGPVHAATLHSIFMHVPGLRVCSPMTPKEYEEIWTVFVQNDDPMLVSEHRVSFSNDEEMPDSIVADANITLYGISAARFNMIRAAEMLAREGVKCNLVHISWLKPFTLTERLVNPLRQSKLGLVVDSGFEIAGAAQSIAYELMYSTGIPVKALGLYDVSVCVNPPFENTTPPSERIAEVVKDMLKSKQIIKKKIEMKNKNIVEAIFINKKNEILLQKKPFDYEFAPCGQWTVFRGEIQDAETPEQTLKREIKEKTGFNVKHLNLFKVRGYTSSRLGVHGKRYVFEVHFDSNKSETALINEGVEFRFFSQKELNSVRMEKIHLEDLKEYFKSKNKY